MVVQLDDGMHGTDLQTFVNLAHKLAGDSLDMIIGVDNTIMKTLTQYSKRLVVRHDSNSILQLFTEPKPMSKFLDPLSSTFAFKLSQEMLAHLFRLNLDNMDINLSEVPESLRFQNHFGEPGR